MKKQTEEIEEQDTVILSKRKNQPNNKATSSEIKTYSAGLNANKGIEECVPLVPSPSASSSPTVASVPYPADILIIFCRVGEITTSFRVVEVDPPSSDR